MLKTDDHILKGMQKCLVDDAFTFVFLSDPFLELLGYTRDEMREEYQNSFFALLEPDVIMFILDELALLSDNTSNCCMSFQMKSKYGKMLYLQLSGYLLEEPEGLAYYFSVLDITQYYEMDSYYRNLLENLPIPVFVSDASTAVKFINERGRAHFCSKRKDLTGLLCSEFGTDSCDTDQCCMKLAKQEPGATHFMRLGDAVYQVYANAMPEREGELPTYCMAALDVSDIFTMSETNRAMVDNTFIGVMKMRCDASRQLLYANEEYYDLLGYSKAAWFSRRKAILQGYCEDGFGDLMTEIDLALAAGQDKVEYEFLTTQQSGKQVWLLMRGRFDRTPEVPELNGVFMDITDRKEAEDQLCQAKERYRIALGHRAIAVWEYNPELRQLRHDDSVSQVYGLPGVIDNMPEVLLERGIIHPDFAAQYLELHSAVRSGQKTASCVVKTRFRDGAYHWTKISYIAEQDEYGKCIRAVGFSEDVTDIKNLQVSSLMEGKDKKALAKNAMFSFEADVTANKVLSAHTEFLSKASNIAVPDKYTVMVDVLLEQYVLQEDKAIVLDTFSQQSLLEASKAGEPEVFCEYRMLDADGHINWMRAIGVLSVDNETKHVNIFNYTLNIDRQKRRQLMTLERAQTNMLSKLLNPHNMAEAVNASLQTAPADRTDALFLISVDNLERVGANFGKTYQESVLRELAYKLASIFMTHATIGRLEDSVFAVFYSGVQIEKANEHMDLLCKKLCQTYTVNETAVTVSTYIGASLSPGQGKTFAALLDNAEKALYMARSSAETPFALYDPVTMENIEQIHLSKDVQVNVAYNGAYVENVPEFIFRLLYFSEDFGCAVNAALRYVCKHFDVQCGYILLFDNADRLYKAYQWNEDDYPVDIPNHPFSKASQYAYLNMFSGSGFCLLPNYTQAPKIFRENQAAKNAKAVLEGSFLVNGHVSGFIGLNEYRNPRLFTDAQKSLFKLLCDLMGTCISAHQLQSKLNQATNLWHTALDTETGPALVIDKEKREVLFANKEARKIYHGLRRGGSCFECLYERNEPCRDCLLDKMEQSGNVTLQQEVYLQKENRWLLATATPVLWEDGETRYLVRNKEMLVKE